MKLIKFRGQRADSGEWIYGHYYSKEIRHGLTNELLETRHFIRPFIQIEMFESLEIDVETLCQFTGRLDNDGKEIYEKDAIIYEHLYAGKTTSIIVYNEEGMGYWMSQAHETLHPESHGWGMAKSIKVIGNIFDNKIK